MERGSQIITGDQFELFVQSVTDYAMFLLDPLGNIQTWNAGARRIKGYEANEVIGKHFSMFYSDVDRSRRKPDYELAVATADGRYEDEGWRIHKDGHQFWANVIITALFRDGKLVGFAKVTRDLTDRRENELRELLAERDTFLSVAAHELKTPVTALNGLAQLLERRLARGDSSPETLQESARLIGRQGTKLVQLVQQLLDVSRLGGPTVALKRSPQDLGALARDVIQVIGAQTGHMIALDAEPGLIASVDPLRFEQILMNLLDNATKFSPGRGKIEVSVHRADGDRIELRVRDYGVGIPMEHRSRIFERFYQGHAETFRSGLGLGLAITQELTRLHDATLHAEYPEDGGTCFVVRIAALSDIPLSDANPNVLIVDDDEAIRSFVGSALSEEGYDVRYAADGAEALKLAATQTPSVILLDMRMPGMNGWEFARAYAQTPEPAPIVAMTASADARASAAQIGATEVLGKPFDLDDLFHVVAALAPAHHHAG